MRLLPTFAVSLLILSACTATETPTDAQTETETKTTDAVPACPADLSVKDGWDDRAPPRRLFGNTYYVGTCGLTALLVTSSTGHVLIDGAGKAAGPLIEANIRMLGFRPEDVNYILNSHEHFDHAGGIAYLQRISGAEVRVRDPAIATFRNGQGDRSDPQFLDGSVTFPPVADVAPVGDGETIRIGDLALTAHATPGHAPGGTSWTWTSCEGTRCLGIAYTDSTSAISDGEYRYSAHPEYIAAFRKGLDTLAALPCDIQITPHPLASDLFARMGGTMPLVDAGACKAYAEKGRTGLDERLAKERAGKAP